MPSVLLNNREKKPELRMREKRDREKPKRQELHTRLNMKP